MGDRPRQTGCLQGGSSLSEKIRALYRKQKRTDEWNTYLTALRQQHKAKRRLIEILDSL